EGHRQWQVDGWGGQMQVITALRFKGHGDAEPREKRLRPSPGCNHDAICIQPAAILQTDRKNVTLRLDASCPSCEKLTATCCEVPDDPLHEALRVIDIAVLGLKHADLEPVGEPRDQIVDGLLIK